jgi:hypothetical protein
MRLLRGPGRSEAYGDPDALGQRRHSTRNVVQPSFPRRVLHAPILLGRYAPSVEGALRVLELLLPDRT